MEVVEGKTVKKITLNLQLPHASVVELELVWVTRVTELELVWVTRVTELELAWVTRVTELELVWVTRIIQTSSTVLYCTVLYFRCDYERGKLGKS
jgi:hypothetical protein